MNNKLELIDSSHDVIVKMSEGNIGALNVCINILKNNATIDPDDAFGGLGPLMSLDTLGLYGSSIWMLYKDVCDQNLPRMLAVLRANQLGYISADQLRHGIDNRGEGLNLDEICKKVAEFLPSFRFESVQSNNT